MADANAAHSTFVIERPLAGSPRHAFRFWADAALKQRWISCHPDWTQLDYSLDFRAGGGEISRTRSPDGAEHGVTARYLDIVEGRRIVYAYDMTVDALRISASLATVLFIPTGTGTLMQFTEQLALLDGSTDAKGRRDGSEIGFERLALELERDLATLQ